jgi:two-component system, cell cycle sensor histidine kinase and response regulator CckA
MDGEMTARDLVELLPQPAWIYDCETLRILVVSDAAVNAYGYSRDEFLGFTIRDIRPPEEIPELDAALQGGGIARPTWHHRRKDGSVFSVQIARSDAIFEGRTARMVIATDVTELVRTAADLRASEEHFRRIADNVPAILWSAEPDARSTWVNRKWLEFRGSEMETELGLGWSDSVHPDDYRRYLQECELAFGSRGTLVSTFRAQDKMGRWRHLLARGEPHVAPDGAFLGYLGTCVDVTEQIEAMEELRRQKELLQTIFDHIPAMVVVFDEAGRLTAVNREWERSVGYTLEQAQSCDIFRALYPDPKVASEVRAFVERADRSSADFVTHTRDGGSLESSWANVRLSDGRRIGIGQDVTERKRLEAQLRQAQKMESVGRLAGGVAHDFNNLLTAILGFSSLAERDVPEGTRARHALEEVRKAGERAATLTRQLLMFSRKSVVAPEVFDLGAVLHDMAGLLRRMIGEDVRLNTQVVPGATVHADRGQIEQVVLNLAVNARDAMPFGGELRLDVALEGDRVLFTVSDDGIGMDANVRAHLFEPFFTTKPVGEGTGLGLATVYGIVQQSGGTIEVESEPDLGATFRIVLPYHRSQVAARSVDRAAVDMDGHGSVLLIEDEETVRRLISAVLEGGGYRVLAARSGEEALRIAADPSSVIDLVVSDLVMPGPNGRETVEAILEVRPGMPHLYMSGYTDDAIVSRGIRTGDSPFIHKPFLPAALLTKVRQVLGAPSRVRWDPSEPSTPRANESP